MAIASKMLVPKKINKYIWLGNWLVILLIVWTGVLIVDFKYNHNMDRTWWFFIIRSIIYIVWEVNQMLEAGFMTLMCDVTVGSTHINLLSTFVFLLRYSVETLSLFLIDYVSYMWYIIYGSTYLFI